MIVGIGIDVVRIERIRAALDRHGERARRRLFTPGELAECDKRANADECLAARFAAKEAALKALGTGKGPGVRWLDLEVVRDGSGPPTLTYAGKVKECAESLGVERSWVSLSHEAGMACAVVILEGVVET